MATGPQATTRSAWISVGPSATERWKLLELLWLGMVEGVARGRTLPALPHLFRVCSDAVQKMRLRDPKNMRLHIN